MNTEKFDAIFEVGEKNPFGEYFVGQSYSKKA